MKEYYYWIMTKGNVYEENETEEIEMNQWSEDYWARPDRKPIMKRPMKTIDVYVIMTTMNNERRLD